MKEHSDKPIHFDIDENLAIIVPRTTGVIKSAVAWNEISYLGRDGKECYLRFQNRRKSASKTAVLDPA